MTLPGTFRIRVPMALESKRLGHTSRVIEATPQGYIVETDGHTVELNAMEIHEFFTPA